MKIDKYNDVILEAMTAAINNGEFCNRLSNTNKENLYVVKYYGWLVLLTLLSPHRAIYNKIFVAVQTKVNEKRLNDFTKQDLYFKYANLNKSLNEIKCNISVLSPYKFKERLNIISRAVRFYKENRGRLEGYLHYVIDYYTIAYYIICNDIEKIVSSGMYERYCTFLSYLGKGIDIEIIGVQDGAAIDVDVPSKIYCNKMYVFDEFEKNIIKKFIANADCKFFLTGFTSTIKWDYLNTEKKILAIASQDWFTDKTLKIAERIMDVIDLKVIQPVIFPHPRENISDYRQLQRKYPDLIVTNSKYKNVDILITFYSTIVYDFWTVNSKLKILCFPIDGFRPSYYDRENVIVADEDIDLRNLIKENISVNT